MSPINPTQVGLWGKPTSTLDWCERNYEVSNNCCQLQTDLFYYLIFPETSKDKR